MIRRRQPVKQARPWGLRIRVNAEWLETKRPLVFLTAELGRHYADACWRGVYVVLTHERTGERWTRTNGLWAHVPPPPPPATTPEDQPRYYWQDRD